MNVSLTPELESLVQEKVQTGMYHSASEVIREALRLLRQRDELRQTGLAALRKEIALGAEQADRGQTAPLNVKALKAKARAALKGRGRPEGSRRSGRACPCRPAES
jgi:antitoxin ParD1/3/4